MRYRVINNTVATELSIDIQCLMIGASQTSFACEAIFFYYPVELMKVTPLYVNVTLHKGPSADRAVFG